MEVVDNPEELTRFTLEYKLLGWIANCVKWKASALCNIMSSDVFPAERTSVTGFEFGFWQAVALFSGTAERNTCY